jgi:release factor glutamine methyltransferase
MYSIKEAISIAVNELREKSEIPQKEARILLAHFLKKDQIYLLMHEDDKIVEEGYFELINRRANYEPIEYITNSANFYSQKFYVDSNVLIPRPETELLVDVVVSSCKGIKNPKIVEIGTGSGIISIMLAKLLPKATIKAIDISKDALKVAKKNAKIHEVEDKIEFITSNLLDNLKDKSFDMLVSNPPYIKNSESLHVGLSYEPSLALFGGEEGSEILVKIIEIFKINNIKYLACEMGYDQKEKIKHYLPNAKFYKDLAGLDRGFLVEKFKKIV